MKKLIYLLVLCMIVFTGCTFNQNKDTYKIKNDEQLVQIMEQYSNEKSVQDLNAITDYLVESEMLLQSSNAKAPLQGFYIGILKDSPDEFKLQTKRKITPSFESILKSSKAFSGDMELILSGEQTYYPEYPAFLDMLWGYYYSTGDDRVIKMMCKIKDKDIDKTIRASAKWSLEAHKQKFPDKIKGCYN